VVLEELKPPLPPSSPVFIHQLEHCILAFLRGVADGVEALEMLFNWVGPYFLIIVRSNSLPICSVSLLSMVWLQYQSALSVFVGI